MERDIEQFLVDMDNAASGQANTFLGLGSDSPGASFVTLAASSPAARASMNPRLGLRHAHA